MFSGMFRHRTKRFSSPDRDGGPRTPVPDRDRSRVFRHAHQAERRAFSRCRCRKPRSPKTAITTQASASTSVHRRFKGGDDQASIATPPDAFWPSRPHGSWWAASSPSPPFDHRSLTWRNHPERDRLARRSRRQSREMGSSASWWTRSRSRRSRTRPGHQQHRRTHGGGVAARRGSPRQGRPGGHPAEQEASALKSGVRPLTPPSSRPWFSARQSRPKPKRLRPDLWPRPKAYSRSSTTDPLASAPPSHRQTTRVRGATPADARPTNSKHWPTATGTR